MKKLQIVIILLLFYNISFSQCVLPVSIPDIECTTGTALTDNATINAGQTYSFNSASGSFSNINLNGGTLVLCGTATISNVNHNGGTLLIKPGANITFSGSYNIGGNHHYFFNLGTVRFENSVQVQNSNQFVYNGLGASLTVSGQMVFLNNGTFVNYGTTYANSIVVNGSNINICMGPGAVSVTESIVSNGDPNHVIVPSGTACVSYTHQFTGNTPISNTPALKICQVSGADNPSSVVVGGATLVTGCNSCHIALPVKLSVFSGERIGETVRLFWKTAIEDNLSHFVIEQSADGRVFKPAGQVSARNLPAEYSYSLHSDKLYFRLKMIDQDGMVTISNMIAISTSTEESLKVFSNPVLNNDLRIAVQSSVNEHTEVAILDMVGRVLQSQKVNLSKGKNQLMFDVSSLSTGVYHFRIYNKYRYKIVSFVKS